MERWLLELIAPHSLGSEILPGMVLRRVSTELGLRYGFEVDGAHPLQVDVGPREPAAPYAARTARLVFGYRVGRSGTVDGERALALCRELASAARDNEAGLIEALAAEPREQGRIRHVEVRSLLEPMGEGPDRFWGLSPYVGCLIGCRFCYAPSRLDALRRLMGLEPVPWGSWVDVRVNAPEVLEDELRRLDPAPPIKLCPIVSDPYHAIERREALTRRCLQVLVREAPERRVMVLTRSTLVRRDLDLIAQLPGAALGVSLPTADDAVREHFEPRAASVPERLHTLRLAREVGITTFAIVQPMLPGSIGDLVEALAAHADSVSLGVLRGVQGAAEDFAEGHAEAATEAWQRAQARRVRQGLRERGVPIWDGELPPG